MKIPSFKFVYQSQVFSCALGLLILFYSGNAHAARRFTPTTSSSSVTMGDASGRVSLQIANTSTNPNNEAIYRVRLTFPTATYNVSSSTTPPTGWSYTIPSVGIINLTTTTNPIARGANLVFNITLTGPGSSIIPRAAANQTDTMPLPAAEAWDNAGLTFARQGALPTWTRYGLKAQLTASPGSVGIDGTISLTFAVTNRTSGTQNGIVPNTVTIAPAGSAVLLTGPLPKTLNLAAGASGNFIYSYRAATIGTTTFSSSARNGASTVTSLAVTSNPVTIGAAQFTITTLSSDVTMGDGAGIVYFQVSNTTASPGRSIMSIRLNFPTTIYESGSGSSGPPGWNVNVVGANAPVEYWTTDPTEAIPPGGSLTFKAEITGRPNGENPIPSAASDQTDTLATAQAWGGSNFTTNPLTRQGALPNWQRKGLKTQIFVTPGSLGVGGNMSAQLLITNRSTAQQNNIAPGTMSFPPGSGNTGSAAWASGPVPGTLSLASGISGSTQYVYQAASVGTVTFSNSTSNGTVSSNPATSNTVEIGSFTAEISIDPVSIGSGYNVTVSMLVTNNGSTSLGNVAPSISVFPGGATATLQSGPAPIYVASLPPGGSGSFLWTYRITGLAGKTYQFQGFATANGLLITNNAVSQVGQVVPYYLILNPDTVASGSVPPNLAINFTVVNNGTTVINRLWFVVATGFTIVSGSGPGAPLGNWAYSVAGNNVNFRAASNGGTGSDLPAGGSATFSIVFSAVPARPENTQFIFQAIFMQGTNYRGTASDYELVTANKISLSYNPAGPLPADGTSIYTVDALLTSGGAPLVGKSVSFTATAGTLSAGTAVTNGSGVARVTLTAPVSSVNTQSVVTATYLGAQDNKTLFFNGYTGPNLLYLGGTLSPTSARVGNSASFGLDVMNSGTAAMNLTTGSYFRFTDGTRIYTANLSAAVSVPAGGIPQHLTFNSTAVNGSFTLGSYYPTLYLTDGGTNNQTRSVSDPVQVIQNIPAGTITLTPVPATITANGSDTSTITSGTIRDAYGNQVLNGEYITVSTDLGTIATADADPATPGIQVVTSGGVIAFILQAGTITGTAHLNANNSAYGGTASGSTTVTFTPGLPAGTIILLPNPGAIPADGASISTVTSGTITDAYGNTVPDGTFITVATSLGTILSSDMDPATPGIQASTSGGMISFVVQSAIITGIANINADDSAYGGTASGSTTITFYSSGAPQAIQDLKANKSTNDLRLYWTAVTQTVDKSPTSIDHYNIYRGTAPDFVPDKVGHANRIGISTNPEYLDVGALLAAGDDYYYLVTSVNVWGLESGNSNMGFKLNYSLQYYPGNSNNNFISIPFYSPYVNAKDLGNDIPNCTAVKKFNPDLETYTTSVTPFTRNNFTLEAGKSYGVVVSSSTQFILVGSHNQETTVNLQFYSGNSNNNYLSVPFNSRYAVAKDLGSDIPNCTAVKKFNPDTETYTSCVSPFNRNNFTLDRGKGYIIVINGNTTWVPDTY